MGNGNAARDANDESPLLPKYLDEEVLVKIARILQLNLDKNDVQIRGQLMFLADRLILQIPLSFAWPVRHQGGKVREFHAFPQETRFVVDEFEADGPQLAASQRPRKYRPEKDGQDETNGDRQSGRALDHDDHCRGQEAAGN